MNRSRNRACSRGFSLVEVMVAVVVICVGLLGIAKMQALSLSNTTTSRQRALAALQAASIASAMHSNREYWAGPSVAAGLTVSITGNPGTVTVIGDPVLQAQTAADLTNLNACVAAAAGTIAACNFTQLAAFDLARWWVNSLRPMLPNATASINCPLIPAGNPSPISCTVQLQWSERAVAVNAQSAVNAGQFQTPTYTLYVQP